VDASELEKRIRAHRIPITPAGMLRERDAATVLGVAPRTLREWRKAGKPPPHVRLNRGTWYSVGVLAAFIGAGEQPQVPVPSGKVRQSA